MKSIFNLFGYKSEQVYSTQMPKEDYEDHMELLLL